MRANPSTDEPSNQTPWVRASVNRPALMLADPRPQISAYHDMPYAIFCYRPQEELALRQEVRLCSSFFSKWRRFNHSSMRHGLPMLGLTCEP